MDTLMLVLNSYEFTVEDFDDFYGDALDVLEETPRDSLISFNSKFSLYKGLERIKGNEYRMAFHRCLPAVVSGKVGSDPRADELKRVVFYRLNAFCGDVIEIFLSQVEFRSEGGLFQVREFMRNTSFHKPVTQGNVSVSNMPRNLRRLQQQA